MSSTLIETVYGAMPPAPHTTQSQLLHVHVASHNHSILAAGTETQSWRVSCSPMSPASDEINFALQLFLPPSSLPRCIIVCGDACWRSISDRVLNELISRDFGLALFNRTEIAPDIAQSDKLERTAAIYAAHPGLEFGAIAAWAWGYHRCLDVIAAMPGFSHVPIAFSGHSRGGKAALLAGATDPRAAITHANNAGVAGSGAYHERDAGSETWNDLARAYPHWVGPRLRAMAVSGERLPFEQDALLATIAPRALLITQAQDDVWANPGGTAFIIEKLRHLYERQGATNRLGHVTREGGHPMQDVDWQALLAFSEAALFPV